MMNILGDTVTPPPAKRLSRSGELWALMAILLLATALRFYGLHSESLWGDEIYSVSRARESLANIVIRYNWQALHALFIHFLLKLGDSEFLLRFPSAVFGVLGVLATYKLGRLFFGSTEALLAAFLLAISPFHLWYSQEARGYADFTALALLAFFLFLCALQKNRWRLWLGFAAATFLHLIAHFFSLAALAAEAGLLGFLWIRDRLVAHDQRIVNWSRLLRFVISILLVVALYLSFYLPGLQRAQRYVGGKIGAEQSYMSIQRVYQLFLAFTATKAILLTTAIGFLCALWASWRRRTGTTWLLLGYLIVPLVGIWMVRPSTNYVSVLHLSRYFLFLYPIYLLIVAKGFVYLGQVAAQQTSRVVHRDQAILSSWLLLPPLLLLLLNLPELWRFYCEPDKIDWRGAGHYLRQQATPADAIFVVRDQASNLPLTAHLLDYYFPVARYKAMPLSPASEPQHFAIAAGRGGAIWYVVQLPARMAERLAANLSDFERVSFYGISLFRRREAHYTAAMILRDALRFDPDSEALQAKLGDVYVEEGDWAAAGQAYQEAVRLKPESEEYKIKLARVFWQMGEVEKAVATLAGSAGVQSHVTLGDLYHGRGEHAKAVEQYRTAVEAWPSRLATRLKLAAALAAAGEKEAFSEALGDLSRFGAVLKHEYGEITDYDGQRLKLSWYTDWRNRGWANSFLQSPSYVQTILVHQDLYPPVWNQLRERIRDDPGSIWLIGMWPECDWAGGRTPEEYAKIYRHLYGFIKDVDPTALVAAGGIMQPTPLRLQWLTAVWEAYEQRYGLRMPVDIWHICNYLLREEQGSWGAGIPTGLEAQSGKLYEIRDSVNVEAFQAQIVAFRQWMAEHGERGKPLLIAEYGAKMPSEYLGDGDIAVGTAAIQTFMTETFDYLLSARDEEIGYLVDGGRLVQLWAWYSLNDKPFDPDTGEGSNGALFDWQDPTVLTPFGEMWARYVDGLH